MQKIGFIGLGKLGATMIACFASKGFNSIGYDKNLTILKNINEGKTPNNETNLNILKKQLGLQAIMGTNVV